MIRRGHTVSEERNSSENITQGESSSPQSAPDTVPLPSRYECRAILGQGGQGAVYRVYDRELERDVALKTLHPSFGANEHVTFFLREARTAAQIEHPNIIPIHDVGTLPDGRPYYTMRLASGRSLERVLRARRDKDDPAAEWSLMQLVLVLQHVCHALEAAHGEGVLHRDVKPSNILLGRPGEVLLVDWGIAKHSGTGTRETTTGVVKGTATYLSPEVLRGEAAGPPSDLYAIGVILYEILTSRLPYDGESASEFMAAALRDPPIPPQDRAPERRIPQELSSLALHALQKNPLERINSARDIANELQSFVEGIQDRDRRHREADKLSRSAANAVRSFRSTRDRLAGVERELLKLEKEFEGWQPLSKKAPLILAREDRSRLERESLERLLSAVQRYSDALVHVPDHKESRTGLGDLFWERFVESEAAGQELLAQTYRALVERFHDGRYTEDLRDEGSLNVSVDPPHCQLAVYPLVEKELQLQSAPSLASGTARVSIDQIPVGRYLIHASGSGVESTAVSVRVPRSQCLDWAIQLPPQGGLPSGFVYIPGGTYDLGGDPLAANGWDAKSVEVPGFGIAKFPVTFQQYCAYLDSQDANGTLIQDEHLPRTDSEGILCEKCDRAWVPRAEVILSHPGPIEENANPAFHLPVFGVSLENAKDYAKWYSKQCGKSCSLPSSEQWEIAARSGDGRIYPWGDAFDLSLCQLRDSHEGQPDVAPVGSFPTDRSAAGVCDLAGGVTEWTLSWFDEARQIAEVRGGSWVSGPPQARSGWRGACSTHFRHVNLGFRLVSSLEANLGTQP